MVFLMSILLVIIILLTVAFLTLMERKFLGYLQTRKGPNKVGMMGIMQPFADAVKLMMKEFFFLSKLNYLIYLMSPIFSLGLILMMWMIFPFMSNYYMMSLGLLYLLCCFSLGVYGLMLSGWASNSMYAMLGSIRSLAQSISYEVSLSIIMIIPMLLIDSLNYMDLLNFQENMNLIIYMWPLSMMFMFSMMAELNRTPFDFSESESELVSGFNVEYMSSGFILLFLSEYASILILSFLFVLVYMGGSINMFFMIKMMIMVIMVVWIRGTLPRFRYDLLMKFCWVQILPFTLNFMFYMIVFKAIF